MRRVGIIGFAGTACALGVAASVTAIDERFEDLSASVEIAPVFTLALDNPQLTFGSVSPETTAVLGSGRFFNEVRCRSNSGRAWYLKAHVLSLKQVETQTRLSAAALQWRVVESTGTAEPAGGRADFHPFAEAPVLLYASQGDDARGEEVILRLQYSLTAPADVPAGSYAGEVVFTMAESP